MYLRSNLGNLVSRVDGCLSSRDCRSQHQTGTAGLLALSLKCTHYFLQMGRREELLYHYIFCERFCKICLYLIAFYYFQHIA